MNGSTLLRVTDRGTVQVFAVHQAVSHLRTALVSNLARKIPSERDMACCFGRIEGVLPGRAAARSLP